MTMTTMRGPAIFLAQFAGDVAPFNSLQAIAAGRPRLAIKACRFRPGTDACSISIGPRTAMPIATR